MVEVSDGPSATALCGTVTRGKWSAELNLDTHVPGSLRISATHMDAAGNSDSAHADIIKDLHPPTASIDTPPTILYAKTPSYTVRGNCSENNRAVEVVLRDSHTGETSPPANWPICTNSRWEYVVDVSGLAEGEITITATHQDEVGNPAQIPPRTATKDTQLPVITIVHYPPINGESDQENYEIRGICDEEGQEITLTVGTIAPFTVNCSSGVWNTNVDMRAQDVPLIVVIASISDLAGNSQQDSKDIQKDIEAPTLTIENTGNILGTPVPLYSLTGACSEDNRTVIVTIGTLAPQTPTCQSNTWSVANLNVESLPNGNNPIEVVQTDAPGQ